MKEYYIDKIEDLKNKYFTNSINITTSDPTGKKLTITSNEYVYGKKNSYIYPKIKNRSIINKINKYWNEL
jgi:hypothetical protein